jgi:hypothetical protein
VGWIFLRLFLILFKQQAKVKYAGKWQYIGTFETAEKAAFAHEVARQELKQETIQQRFDLQEVETVFESARYASFEKVESTRRIAREKSKAVIEAVNAAAGGKYDRAAALAA